MNSSQNKKFLDKIHQKHPQVLTTKNLGSVFNRHSMDLSQLRRNQNMSKQKNIGQLRRSKVKFNNKTERQTYKKTSVERQRPKIIENKTDFRKSYFKNQNEYLETKKKFFNARGYSYENRPTHGTNSTLKVSYHRIDGSTKLNSSRMGSSNSIKLSSQNQKRNRVKNSSVPVPDDNGKSKDYHRGSNYEKLRENVSSRNFNENKSSFVFARNGYLTQTTEVKKINIPNGTSSSRFRDITKSNDFMQQSVPKHVLTAYRRKENRKFKTGKHSKEGSVDLFSQRKHEADYKFPKSEKKILMQKSGIEMEKLKISKSFNQGKNLMVNSNITQEKKDLLGANYNLRKSDASVGHLAGSLRTSKIDFSGKKVNDGKVKDLEEKIENLAKELLDRRQDTQKLIEKNRKKNEDISKLKKSLKNFELEFKKEKEKFQKLDEEKKKLENENLKLNEKNNILENKNKQINDELNQRIKDLTSNFEKDREDLIDMNLDLEDALKTAKSELVEVLNIQEKSQIENSLQEALKEIENLKKSEFEIIQKKNIFKEENCNLKLKLQDIKTVHISELKDFKEQISTLTEICHKYQQKLDSFSSQDEEVSSLKERYRRMEKAKNNEIFVLRNQNMELNTRLQNSIIDYNQKMKEMERFQEDARESVERSEQDRRSIHQDLNQLETHYMELKRKLEFQISMKNQLQDELVKKIEEVGDLKREMKSLRKENSSLKEKSNPSFVKSSYVNQSNVREFDDEFLISRKEVNFNFFKFFFSFQKMVNSR